MSEVLSIGDITAIACQRPDGSEVLLFKRNEGLLSRVIVPQKGKLLKRRLEASIQRILMQHGAALN